MASSSKTGASIRRTRGKEDIADGRWKTAPSRETTHADPGSHDVQVRSWRKKEENAPKKRK
jgi:hypothetical protein